MWPGLPVYIHKIWNFIRENLGLSVNPPSQLCQYALTNANIAQYDVTYSDLHVKGLHGIIEANVVGTCCVVGGCQFHVCVVMKCIGIRVR